MCQGLRRFPESSWSVPVHDYSIGKSLPYRVSMYPRTGHCNGVASGNGYAIRKREVLYGLPAHGNCHNQTVRESVSSRQYNQMAYIHGLQIPYLIPS